MFNKEEKKVAEELTQSSNTIGKGTSIQGDVTTFGNIRIDGKLVGNVTTKSKIVLGKSAEIEGNIVAQNAEIEGSVKGTVSISELLTLKSSAAVTGDITTNKLVVDAGAVWNGTVKMGEVQPEIKLSENGRYSRTEKTEIKQYA
ncbi:MAG: polymer-forming cytoskeletal protein [Cytophagales bacterium]|nr:polymer-forming cytoskeletal protein [Cytophagales bacterium]